MKPLELMPIYHALLAHFGPQHWWPAQSKLEIVVGAVLTQNTSWHNVSKALNSLKNAGALKWAAINRLSVTELATLIRASGYHNVKAARLRNLLMLFKNYQPWTSFFKQETVAARELLLKVKGIGPETADALLLYAGNQPVFVVDAYSSRLLSRHGWLPEKASYHAQQTFFTARLPQSTQIFNEFHALIVALGKNYCHKSKPLCASCPLNIYLP